MRCNFATFFGITYEERWRDRPCETLATSPLLEKVPNPIPILHWEKIS
jgi:hypothetical protein